MVHHAKVEGDGHGAAAAREVERGAVPGTAGAVRDGRAGGGRTAFVAENLV